MKNRFKTILFDLLGIACAIGTTPVWAAGHEKEKKDSVDYEQLKIKSYKHWDPLRPKFKNLTGRIFEKSAYSPQYEEAELFDAELLKWLGQT